MSNEAFFIQQLSIGETGEDVVKDILTQRTNEVVDVRTWRSFQKRDIDFRCFINNVGYSVEVKTDSYVSSTGNIAIELSDSSNRSRNGLGWYYYTEADVLAYVCRYTLRSWFFRMSDIQNYIENYNPPTNTSTFGGNQLTNALIDIEDFRSKGYYLQQFDETANELH